MTASSVSAAAANPPVADDGESTGFPAGAAVQSRPSEARTRQRRRGRFGLSSLGTLLANRILEAGDSYNVSNRTAPMRVWTRA